MPKKISPKFPTIQHRPYPYLGLYMCTILPLQDVDTIFGDIAELHELSVQLVGSLEDCIEMAGEMQGARCPQAGFVFEELAEVTTYMYVQLVCVHVRMCVYGCMYCALKFGLEELAELGCVYMYLHIFTV